jgi:cullin-4
LYSGSSAPFDDTLSRVSTLGYRVLAVVVATSQDKEMVERLLQLKAQLDDVLSSAFQASPAFADQLTSAFQSAVNSRSNKPAELVAKFIDAKLRGSKGVGEGELEVALDKALVLFGYIQVCYGVAGLAHVLGLCFK